MSHSSKKSIAEALGTSLKAERETAQQRFAHLFSALGDSDDHLTLEYVPVAKIRPNPEQPRKHFDPESLEELAQSVKERGIVVPLLGVKTGDASVTLIAGERRLRAAHMVGLASVPMVLRGPAETAGSLAALAVVENIQRKDLSPAEEVLALGKLYAHFHTQEALARAIGVNRSTLANKLSLLHLSEELLVFLSPVPHSLSDLLRLGKMKPEAQWAAARKITERGSGVRPQSSKPGILPNRLDAGVFRFQGAAAGRFSVEVKLRRRSNTVGDFRTALVHALAWLEMADGNVSRDDPRLGEFQKIFEEVLAEVRLRKSPLSTRGQS